MSHYPEMFSRVPVYIIECSVLPQVAEWGLMLLSLLLARDGEKGREKEILPNCAGQIRSRESLRGACTRAEMSVCLSVCLSVTI